MGVKEDIVSLFNAQLIGDNMTKDDGSTHASYYVNVVNPPHVKVKDWFSDEGRDYNGLFTVADLRAENKRIMQNVPHVEDGRYLVKTWTIAKNGVDGIKLKQKMDNEVKRIFKAYPTRQRVVSWDLNDRLTNGKWVYSTTFTIAKTVLI